MKKNILRISILPLMLLVALSFAGLQPQKDNNKGNKNNNAEVKGNQGGGSQGNKGNGNADKSRGNHSNEAGQPDKGQGQGKRSQASRGNDHQDDRGNQNGKGNDNSKGNKSNGNNSMSKNDNGKGNDKGNGNGKSHRETIKWDRDENINWGFENYSGRKRPQDFKKVTVCHNTGNSDAPVTISVSENALKAHLNHGDQVGNCTGNYSNRWPADLLRTRENVYNSYETTWETMSYSEALLRFAADKLLGIKSTFQTQRPTLSAQEIERRELLIMELQNNVNSLENQLAVSRQRIDGININIVL